MFAGCSNITEINLSNFNTSLITDTGGMFRDCSLLESLDLSNFNTLINICLAYMFERCSGLKYINFGYAQKRSDTNDDNIFINTNDNLVICSTYIDWNNNILLQSEWTQIDINCNNNNNNTDNSNGYKCFIKKNKNLEYNKYICNDICGYNYYQIEDSNNFICNELQTGYYLEQNDNNNYPLSKPCYSSCKTCNKYGNKSHHNCIECGDNYKNKLLFKFNYINNYINCYNICEYYYYTDILTNITYCTSDFSCPENYNKIIINKSECIDNCSRDEIYKYEYNNECYIEDPYSTTYFTTYYNTDIIIDDTTVLKNDFSTVISTLTNENFINNFNISEYELFKEYILNNVILTHISEGQDFEKIKDNILFTFSSTDNQKNNIYINKTSIILGQCEYTLKKEYNISLNKSLYILKIDNKEEGMKIPKIEYEVYYPLYNNQLINLNLSRCENTKIDILIPVDINNENIDKYNKSSPYYNDICSKTRSESKADITISDRQKEFVYKNMTLCE